jgi:hypothetical protein
LQRGPWKEKKVCNWVPDRVELWDSNGGDQIPARRIAGGEGEVGKKFQELTAGLGVAGIEEGRCGDGGSTED